MGRENEDRQAWQDWIHQACAAVGIDPGEVPVAEILDLAGDVARGVARPMAPVTAFIAGVAVGRGAEPQAVIAALAAAARPF